MIDCEELEIEVDEECKHNEPVAANKFAIHAEDVNIEQALRYLNSAKVNAPALPGLKLLEHCLTPKIYNFITEVKPEGFLA